MFVHHTAIQADGFRELRDDQRVEFDIVQGNKGPQAEAVSRHDGLALAIQGDGERIAPDHHAVEAVVLGIRMGTGPGRTDIAETDHLEIVDEVRAYRSVHDVAEERQAHLRVHHPEAASVARIVEEAAHGHRHALEAVVLVGIHRDGIVHLGEEPVVHAAEEVGHLAASEGTATRQARHPDHFTVDAQRMA
ncbi:MAG: cold shock domain-containing protein [Flavobacteriales bacterium]